ncbi:hypothetical protein QTP88_013141 [Uroleucon formosanum]
MRGSKTSINESLTCQYGCSRPNDVHGLLRIAACNLMVYECMIFSMIKVYRFPIIHFLILNGQMYVPLKMKLKIPPKNFTKLETLSGTQRTPRGGASSYSP